MKLVAVFESFLSNPNVLNKFFSINELNSLSKKSYSKKIRVDRLLGRIALKSTLADGNFPEINVDYINNGEPKVKDFSDVYCSISHSFGLGVASSATFRIGVDVEKIRQHDPLLLKEICSEEELAFLNDKDVNRLITKFWVIKESVSKTIGLGLTVPFNQIIVCGKKTDESFLVKEGSKIWTVDLFTLDQYIIGLCHPFQESGKKRFEIEELK